MSYFQKLLSALGATYKSDSPSANASANAVMDEASVPDLPTLIVTFPHPNQPQFHFVNWENAPSIGSLERMTHLMYRAAQMETMAVRHKTIKEAEAKQREADAKKSSKQTTTGKLVNQT